MTTTKALEHQTGDKRLWQDEECIVQAVRPDGICVVQFPDGTTKRVLGTSLGIREAAVVEAVPPEGSVSEAAPLAASQPVPPVATGTQRRTYHKAKLATGNGRSKTANAIAQTSHNSDFSATKNPDICQQVRQAIRMALGSATRTALLTDQPIIKAHYEGYAAGFEAALAIIAGSAGLDLSWMEDHDGH